MPPRTVPTLALTLLATLLLATGANAVAPSQMIASLGPAHSGTPFTPEVHARIALSPQGFGVLLRNGIALRLITDRPVDGLAIVSIPRSDARAAHIPTGRRTTVIVGRGTLSDMRAGTVNLRLRLSDGVARKLGRLRHVTLTIRLMLVAADRSRVTLSAAGRY